MSENPLGTGFAKRSATMAGITLFLDGRPRWVSTPEDSATEHQIVERYLQDDAGFLAHLDGPFALALLDATERRLLLAIDRMGICQLAWARHGSTVAFSTSPLAVARGASTQPALRYQALYNYFFFHMVPSPGSVFDGVSKLQNGTMEVFKHGAHHTSTYWAPRFTRPSRNPPFSALREELHASVEGAVRTADHSANTGAFLSGGLDSSTVSGYLARISPAPARTFSMGFGVPEYDELEYARIANRHFGCKGHEYEVTPDDLLGAIDTVVDCFDEPFGNSSALPTYLCARFASKNGIECLLAGDGGDELFAGNERYARQQVFELFGRIPAPMRAAARHIAQGVPIDSRLTALRKLKSYVDQASTPLPDRFETWNFTYREGARVMFQEDFMAEIDPTLPMMQMRQVFQTAPSDDLLDKMLYYDWKFTLADNDLRKVTQACSAAGVDVEYPMLDARVVALSTRVSSRQKMRRLELRTFYKRAMTGFLPDEILNKSKHGFGLPFGVWLKEHPPLAERVYQSLTDLKSQDIVRPAFIDRLIEDHRTGHPGYYGYVIWDLVILQEWLSHLPASHSIVKQQPTAPIS